MKKSMETFSKIFTGLFIFFVLTIGSVQAEAIIIDHTCTDLSQIPSNYIGLVTNSAKMLYAHTSHGSQITVGMQRVEDSDSFYSVAIHANYLPDESGAVCILDPGFFNPQDYFTYGPGRFSTYPSINFSMYSWCNHQNTNSEADTQAYLDGMEALEAAYSHVTFIYMTGNAQADGSAGYNRYLRNNQIRDYCQAHGKILFDFADIDSWYNGQQHTYNYQGHDIPLEHPQFNGSQAGHTTYESCELKASAAWWMMALLMTGGDPPPDPPEDLHFEDEEIKPPFPHEKS